MSKYFDEEKLYSLATECASKRFTLAEIKVATQNFDDDLVIGKGGFGKVYKGSIYDNGDTTAHLLAVKRLDSYSRQGPSEFMTEIEMLSKLRHCNLVSLIGYCCENNEMILVYEYVPNGNIENLLHNTDTPLSWMHRLKISIGAARGLDYLHTGVGTQNGIIHRDVKSSNILLDENWAAKISDFGLSKIIDEPFSGVSTVLKGTFGYLDPEYSMTGHLTRKSDVYSFGVVLFELLSGRRAVDTRFKEDEWNLANWAKKCVKERRYDQVVSSHIITQIAPKCLKEFVQIAERCLESTRKKRPTMAEVMVALQKSIELQEQFDISSQAVGSTGFTRMQNLFFGSRYNSGDPDTPSSTHNGYTEYSFRIFPYRDMKLATKNFTSRMLLGRGHCGEVFRGWLHKKTYSPSVSESGLAIAVKRLYTHKFKPHIVKEIQLKMKILEEFNDPNIVKILGYCVEEDSVLIVYEFMHQGTLKDYLFSVERRTERHQFISRVKIAIGVAKGLVFLGTQPQLADCSLQMHNILLDEEFNAKLSDFDVAMLVPSSDAPLYPSSSYDLKVKSGVFAFGVLLMQLLTGKPIDSESDLTATRHCLPGEHGFVSLPSIYGALDCRIRLNFQQTKPAVQLALLAQKCVVDKSYQRPTLESMLEELEEIYDLMLNFGNSSN